MKVIKPLLFLLMTTSCVKDVDFDQADNFSLSPVIETSVVYFNEPANTFFVNNEGEEVSEVQDAAVVDLFDDSFIIENLIKAVFTFKITNSIERAFQTRVDFIDPQDEVQYSFTINTEASVNNQNLITNYIEVFEGDDLAALKTTNKIAFNAILPPSNDGSVIDENTLGRIELQSKATFYLNINTGE